MHPRTHEVLSQLDAYRSALEDAIDQIPASVHRTRPAPDRWSVAEIVEHLSLVEGRIDQLMLKELAAARAAGVGAERETSPVTATLDVARLLDRGRPLTASEASVPSGNVETGQALAALRTQRRALRDALVAADGLALGAISIPHPRLGTLNMYQWLLFLAAHEGRHTAQLRETAAALQR